MRYLPVNRPDASGKYGMKLMPSFPQAGSTSSRASRARRLYSFCTVTNRRTPFSLAASSASSSCSAEKFEHPISRTFPSSTRRDIAVSVSAIGVASSGVWIR